MVQASVLLVVWLLPWPIAADSEGDFAIKGVGLMTCEQYLVARSKEEMLIFAVSGWLDGYITAINQLSEQTFDIAPWESQDLLSRIINSHCIEHPDHRLASLAYSIVKQLKRDRLTGRSALVPVRNKERGILVYEEILKRVQITLANQGLFAGEVGNPYDHKMRGALEQYQTQHELPVTGLPDPATLWHLFRPTAQP